MAEGPAREEISDVCIIGAGPAGLTLARSLAAAGRRVLLLESGGARPSASVQELNAGDVRGERYAGLQSTRHRRIGGTPHLWDVRAGGKPAAKYAPLSPGDLKDWPLGWNELAPYYERAQALCGLGPFRYAAEDWATEARRPFALNGTGLMSGVYQFGSADRWTRELVAEVRGAPEVTLAEGTTAVGLRFAGGRRRVEAVRAVRGDGRRLEARARIVILACGAIENSRLLLLESRAGGERSPWLGRCFMEHARDFSLVLVPDSPELFTRAGFYDLHAAASGVLIGGHLTLTAAARERLRLPNAALTLVPRARRRRRLAAALLGRLGRRAPRYGWSRLRAPQRAFDAFGLVMNLEQRPQPENAVELGERADRFGNPLPRVTLRWTEDEQAELERLRRAIAEWMSQAGLGRLLVTPGRRPDLSAHHHAGTTRMAAQPDGGVVDPQGLVFGSDNLYLAGASVFPSAGFANPTLTIVALALRLADRVDDVLG